MREVGKEVMGEARRSSSCWLPGEVGCKCKVYIGTVVGMQKVVR